MSEAESMGDEELLSCENLGDPRLGYLCLVELYIFT